MATTGGRKLIKHEYPNSKRRYIEDLGKKQRDFTIVGLITGPNYLAKKRKLINALESEGAGILVHPFWGRISVTANPYNLIEDMRGIGSGRVEMSFSVPSENIFPTSKGLFNIPSLSIDLNISIKDFIDLSFLDTFSDVLLLADDALNAVYNVFDDVTRLSAGLSDNLSSLKRTISDAKANIPASLQDFEKIYDSFNDTFDGITNLFDSPKDTVNLIADNFFGRNIVVDTIDPTTQVRTDTKSNNDVINQSVNTLALSYAYANASQIDYDNDQNLITLLDALEDQYLFIIEDADDTVAASINALRNDFRSFTDNLIISLDRVTEVDTKPVPMLMLAFQEYGSTEKYEELIDLNDTLNPSEVSGNIKVLTA